MKYLLDVRYLFFVFRWLNSGLFFIIIILANTFNNRDTSKTNFFMMLGGSLYKHTYVLYCIVLYVQTSFHAKWQSIDFQPIPYRSFFLHAWSSCFKNLRRRVCWWDEPFTQLVIDNKALTQVDSNLNTLALGLKLSDMRKLCSIQTKLLHTWMHQEQWAVMSWCNFLVIWGKSFKMT